jgi:ATP-binding cassette subfamily B protein
MAAAHAEPVTRFASLRRAFGRPALLLLRHRRLVLAGLCCVPIHAAIMLVMPGLIGDAIDGIATTGAAADPPPPRTALAATCSLLLALALGEAASRYVSRKTLIDVSRHVERDLKQQLLTHLQTLPVSWYDRARTGDLVSRLTQDVELVRFVMGPLLLHGGSALCLLPGGVVLMAQLNLPVTLCCAVVMAVLLGVLRILMPRMRVWSQRAQEAIGNLSQRAQEDFAGIRVVQQFGIADRERAAMATSNRRYVFANLRLVRLRSWMHAVIHSTTGAVMLGVLLIGGLAVIDGELTVGQLFQFTAYLQLMLFPLEILGWTLSTLPRAHASGIRIAELFEAAPEVATGIAPDLRGHLRVRGLTFTYPEASRPALQNVSFDVLPGQKLGLVGPVGSGKSTLLSLCLRFYDPPRGTVFLDGHDVLDLQPAAIRAAFALAPQEPFLFSDTLAANVGFARSDAPAVERDAAVAAAALDQDLPQLHEGLETLVGERGVTLSGGQKQRVSLARALLSQRPALLLDDTLSAVDPETERRILAGLRRGRRGRTMLVATHRLSVVTDADLILVLRSGEIEERGTHRELLRRGGTYAAGFRRQSEAQALERAEEAE